ncbi:MAG TPA: DUF6569 family protein [Terriglobales bacterium]|nr:DUF6569 family protein [Terriglobales bacterium]
MNRNAWLGLCSALAISVAALTILYTPAKAGQTAASSPYKVLAPIQHGNLTVFPVIAVKTYDTHDFLTLDEGLSSGEVVVTEFGSRPMIRRRPRPTPWPYPSDGAQVNRLVLVNNSKRPLILLAGEIVTGGKQDRVIGKDRLVPAESDPIDLGVFCVEPGRWVATTSKFNTMSSAMAAPAVRGSAMAAKDQQKVWSEVRRNQEQIVAGLAPSSTETVEVQSTSSYARVMDNQEVRKQVDSIAVPVETSYRSVMKELRDRNAVGVVVAVNGEFIWADIFASTALLQKYWPKLVRSYAAEAITTQARARNVDERSAQAFLDKLEGTREVAETEPGLYRQTEITGDGFKAFELTSLLPKTGFDLHIAKMAE